MSLVHICLAGVLVLAGLAVGFALRLLNERRSLERECENLRDQVADWKTRWSTVDDKRRNALRDLEWARLVFNNTSDMVYVHSLTEEHIPSKFIEVNDEMCRELECTREELLTLSPLEVEHSDVPVSTAGYTASDMVILSDEYIHKREAKFVRRHAQRMMEELLRSGQAVYEATFQGWKGRKIPVEVSARCFNVEGRAMVLCMARDITERKAAERALQESRRRFQNFFMHSPIGVAIYDSERNLVDINRACQRMFGIPDRVEFERLNPFEATFIPAECRDKIKMGESIRCEAVVDFDQILKRVAFVTSRTGIAHFDIQITNMGQDENYQSRGYIMQVQDVTERRRAEEELKSSEQRLRQAEKMEAIGSMAGGIAHDFNNILTPIIGYTTMLLKSEPKPEVLRKYLTGILKASHRAKDLVGQILTFSRRGTPEEEKLRPIRVSPIIKEVINLQKTSLPENVQIQHTIKTERDVVMANPTKIHQVLMNLCTNAGHAMAENGGTLELLVTEFVLQSRQKALYPELEPGRFLRISVKDTGTGMDGATLARIFEPFFTTKKIGKGTGMGLAVVQGIVKGYKGIITVESELGKGSIFHVVLPARDEEPVALVEEATADLPRGRERILVVDDDVDVLEMEVQMLNSLGYQTVSVASAEEAREIFQRSEPFDLVIADQSLPGQSGTDLLRHLLQTRQDLPVVLCTGYGQDVTLEKAREAGVREFLRKPVAVEDLAQIVRHAMDVAHSPKTKPGG
jgi:PAS domain S-box-containing protein